MGAPDDDELRALRGRAYGPGADIQGDSHALERLRELEGRESAASGRQPSSTPVEVETRADDRVEQSDSEDPALDEIPLEHPARVWATRAAQLARTSLRRLARLRRSTVLVIVGLLALASVLVVALNLVDRVQTDPLQTGAAQVARLSIDPAYEVPTIFLGGPDEAKNSDARGFEEFLGLRTIITPTGFFYGGDTADDCMSIFIAAAVDESDPTSFSGPVFGGCAAGTFPAATQFRVDIPGLPDELTDAYPDSTALQFVYDSENREIVVFASK